MPRNVDTNPPGGHQESDGQRYKNTLIDLCDLFNQLWQKVVNPEEMDHMQDDIARILSNLEMFFPPSFFDVMVHLTVHLVDEIKYCGPVFLRNIYPSSGSWEY